MKESAFHDFLALLDRLDKARIAYTLARSREDALVIRVDVPGERWEIEFVAYGDEVHVEIERFRSNGVIYDEAALEKLFTAYAADSPELAPEQVQQENETFFRGHTCAAQASSTVKR